MLRHGRWRGGPAAPGAGGRTGAVRGVKAGFGVPSGAGAQLGSGVVVVFDDGAVGGAWVDGDADAVDAAGP
ncbi:hypothetical protein KCH_77970 [Kitasatospora cheerisanensis KCTC 2395]|uniref:Uncharacterized protein n=1 Tax=Kitasatospora cheerisanensis KCTC 2395 TaxID=1348663 RepID=A0A066YRA6_9ACTN|nr:hypothetical protein KCH_77970 [Kitasatospora cheerisanensis KCTC 2395]